MTYHDSVLDLHFIEPHELWDEYVAARDAEYEALIKGKTCLDCAKCKVSEKHPDTGFCTEDGEFRYDTDSPEELGLECFAEEA